MVTRPALLALLASAVLTTAASAQGAWHQYSQSATKFFNSGDYVQAEGDCRKALKEMPQEDPRYMLSLMQLGKIYLAQNRPAKASRVFEYGMDMCREKRPIDLDLYCEILAEQVKAHKASNRLDLAKIAQDQIAFITPKPTATTSKFAESTAVANPSPEWKQLRSALSNCYREQRFADAEPILKRYLALMEQECGKDSPLLVPIMNQYSRVLRYVGKGEEAERIASNVEAMRASCSRQDAGAPRTEQEDALDDLEKRARDILRDQRERERQEVELRAKEEQRIAAAQAREREAQLIATRQFEERELAAHLEREKAAMQASRTRFSTTSLPGNAGTRTPGFTSPAVFSSPASGVAIGGLGFSAAIGNASK